MINKINERYLTVLDGGRMRDAHKLINGIGYREPGINMHFETLQSIFDTRYN